MYQAHFGQYNTEGLQIEEICKGFDCGHRFYKIKNNTIRLTRCQRRVRHLNTPTRKFCNSFRFPLFQFPQTQHMVFQKLFLRDFSYQRFRTRIKELAIQRKIMSLKSQSLMICWYFCSKTFVYTCNLKFSKHSSMVWRIFAQDSLGTLFLLPVAFLYHHELNTDSWANKYLGAREPPSSRAVFGVSVSSIVFCFLSVTIIVPLKQNFIVSKHTILFVDSKVLESFTAWACMLHLLCRHRSLHPY